LKPRPLFLNILLIVIFSLSLLTSELVFGKVPEHVSGVTPPSRRLATIGTPEALAPLLNITAITAGYKHTCALTVGGGVKCWGGNSKGQLGDGTNTGRLTPVNVSGLASGVSAIAVDGQHTCALTTAGGVKCWGDNTFGQLGDNTIINRTTPVDVSGLASGVSAITAGWVHTCALTTDGGVKCWGNNSSGQLGDNTTTERHTPVDVSGLASGVSAITAGGGYTCALTAGGGVKCWGSNFHGQLGDGTTADRHTPVDVSELASGVSAITAGNSHTCARTAEGGVKCWGWNSKGQLGDGSAGTDRLKPVDVNGLASGVSAIAAGEKHTCARTTVGGVKCWGDNTYGQLGDDTTTNNSIPVNVSGLASGISAITDGSWHTCALTSGGGLKCWGYNFTGQLGDNTTTDRHTPVDVVVPTLTKSYRSAGSQDGWVLESNETSNNGGTLNADAILFRLGDDISNRQYRSILSFDTSNLPDDATITSARLKIKMQGLTGTNPFTSHGNIKVDMRKGAFAGNNALQLIDFQAAASKNAAGTIMNTPSSGWYPVTFNSSVFTYINLTGVTQFRLRFAIDDNNDNGADYLKFYSGNYSNVSLRPLLVIEYYVP
jgi:alpha-tubulin suppressor-like RCC1 family protein